MSEALAFADSLEKQLSRTLGALPVLLPILERLDVRGIVDRYCPSGADLDNGTVALALVPVVAVSNQAMLSAKAIGAYARQDMGFLGPLPARKQYEALLMEPSLEQLKQHPLAYRSQRQASEQKPAYYAIKRPITLTGECAGEQHAVEAQALILYSRGEVRLDRKKRQR